MWNCVVAFNQQFVDAMALRKNKKLRARMKDGVNQGVLECVTHFISTGCLNACRIYATVVNWCRSQWFILVRQVCCRSMDPGCVEGLVDWDGKSQSRAMKLKSGARYSWHLLLLRYRAPFAGSLWRAEHSSEWRSSGSELNPMSSALFAF